MSAIEVRDPMPSRRIVVEWSIPAVVGDFVGRPRFSGLAWHLGAARRSEAIEAIIWRAVAVSAESEAVR